MSNVYPSIPDPQPTVESLADTVRLLKSAVELLTGQRTGGTAAHVFVQTTTPVALSVGDIWIDKQNSSLVRYWTGTDWLKVTIT